jgi:hypothetical protein
VRRYRSRAWAGRCSLAGLARQRVRALARVQPSTGSSASRNAPGIVAQRHPIPPEAAPSRRVCAAQRHWTSLCVFLNDLLIRRSWVRAPPPELVGVLVRAPIGLIVEDERDTRLLARATCSCTFPCTRRAPAVYRPMHAVGGSALSCAVLRPWRPRKRGLVQREGLVAPGSPVQRFERMVDGSGDQTSADRSTPVGWRDWPVEGTSCWRTRPSTCPVSPGERVLGRSGPHTKGGTSYKAMGQSSAAAPRGQ